MKTNGIFSNQGGCNPSDSSSVDQTGQDPVSSEFDFDLNLMEDDPFIPSRQSSPQELLSSGASPQPSQFIPSGYLSLAEDDPFITELTFCKSPTIFLDESFPPLSDLPCEGSDEPMVDQGPQEDRRDEPMPGALLEDSHLPNDEPMPDVMIERVDYPNESQARPLSRSQAPCIGDSFNPVAYGEFCRKKFAAMGVEDIYRRQLKILCCKGANSTMSSLVRNYFSKSGPVVVGTLTLGGSYRGADEISSNLLNSWVGTNYYNGNSFAATYIISLLEFGIEKGFIFQGEERLFQQARAKEGADKEYFNLLLECVDRSQLDLSTPMLFGIYSEKKGLARSDFELEGIISLPLKFVLKEVYHRELPYSEPCSKFNTSERDSYQLHFMPAQRQKSPAKPTVEFLFSSKTFVTATLTYDKNGTTWTHHDIQSSGTEPLIQTQDGTPSPTGEPLLNSTQVSVQPQELLRLGASASASSSSTSQTLLDVDALSPFEFQAYCVRKFQEMGIDYLSPAKQNILSCEGFDDLIPHLNYTIFSGNGRLWAGTLSCDFSYTAEDTIALNLIHSWFGKSNASGDYNIRSSQNYFAASYIISLLEFGIKKGFFNKEGARGSAAEDYFNFLFQYVKKFKLDLSTPFLFGIYSENTDAQDGAQLEKIISVPLQYVLCKVYHRFSPFSEPCLGFNTVPGIRHQFYVMSVSLKERRFSCKTTTLASYLHRKDSNREGMSWHTGIAPVVIPVPTPRVSGEVTVDRFLEQWDEKFKAMGIDCLPPSQQNILSYQRLASLIPMDLLKGYRNNRPVIGTFPLDRHYYQEETEDCSRVISTWFKRNAYLPGSYIISLLEFGWKMGFLSQKTYSGSQESAIDEGRSAFKDYYFFELNRCVKMSNFDSFTRIPFGIYVENNLSTQNSRFSKDTPQFSLIGVGVFPLKLILKLYNAEQAADRADFIVMSVDIISVSPIMEAASSRTIYTCKRLDTLTYRVDRDGHCSSASAFVQGPLMTRHREEQGEMPVANGPLEILPSLAPPTPVPESLALAPPTQVPPALVPQTSVLPRIDQAAAQRVHKQFRALSRKLETYYGSTIPDEFRAVLQHNRGKWGIDFSSADHLDLPRDAFLKPFQEFLLSPHSSQDKKAALEAVEKMFRFFRFTASPLESGETEADAISPLAQYEREGEVDPSLVGKCIEELLRKAAPVDELEEASSPLSEIAAKEVKQSFLTLKLAELRVVANHFVQTNQDFNPVPAQQIPCFLLTQDANRIGIQIMAAHFDSQECLTHFSEDSEQIATSFLTEVLGEEFIINENESRGKYATLTLPQLAGLQAALSNPHARSRLPKALMLERLDPVAAIEEALTTSSVPTRDRSRTDRDLERGGQKRRVDSEVLRPPHKKRRIENERSGGSELRGNEKRRDMAWENEYTELEEVEEVAQAKSVSRSKNPTGILPIVYAQGNPLASLSSEGKLTVHNFWNELNRQSISAIESKVQKQVIKETVLEELSPLDYPIFDALSKLPPSTPYHPWCRILKPYQVKAVAELLRFCSASLSELLSLEMGLGKTFIFGEFIAQRISKSAAPQLHIVAVPLSLREQTQRELTKFLLEASVTGWQMIGQCPQNTGSYILLADTVNELGDDLGNFTRFLRILTYFPHAKKVLKHHQYAKLSSADHLERTRAALFAHHDHIVQLCQHDPRMQQEWDAKIRSFCLDFSYPEFESFNALIDHLVRPNQSEDERFASYRLAGTILDCSPERTNLLYNDPNLSDEAIKNIRNLGFISHPERSPVFIAETSREIRNAIGQSLQAPQILVTAHQHLYPQLDTLKTLPIGSLVIDEASKIHSPESVIANRVQDVVTELKLHATPQKENAVLLVTGTPFENSIEELWKLFQLNNGQAAFPDKTLASLNTALLTETIKQLTNPEKIGNGEAQESLESLLIKSFAHFMQLHQLSEQLVYRLKRSDDEVIANWNGRFPTVNYQKIAYRLSEEALEELKADEPEARRRGIFWAFKRAERFVIHPSLKNTTLDEQQKKKFPFLDILRKKSRASREEKIAWTKQSAYLQAVLTHSAFQTALANKEKIVVVVNTHAQSKTYKKAIKLLFADSGVNVFEYHGDQSSAERDGILNKFTDPSTCTPQVLLLMLKVGGVGLNLPQAKWLFLATIAWNRATEDQVIARLVRANQTGSKNIFSVVFPDLYEFNHPKMIQKVKSKYEAFLWQGDRSPGDSLDLWLDVLKAETFRAYLNQLKSKELAKEANLTVESVLDAWKQTLSEEDLRTAIEKATPVVKSSKRPTSSRASSNPQAMMGSLSDPVQISSVIRPLPLPLPASQGAASAQNRPLRPVPLPLSTSQGSSSSSSARQTSSQVVPLTNPAQKKPIKPMPLPLPLPTSQSSSSSSSVDRSQRIVMSDYLVIPLPYTKEDAICVANYIGQNKDTSEQIQRIAQLIRENERAGIRQQLRSVISTEGTPASEIIKILEGFKERAGKMSEELLGNVQIYQLTPHDNQMAFLIENINPQMEPQVKLRLASDGLRYDILLKKR